MKDDDAKLTEELASGMEALQEIEDMLLSSARKPFGVPGEGRPALAVQSIVLDVLKKIEDLLDKFEAHQVRLKAPELIQIALLKGVCQAALRLLKKEEIAHLSDGCFVDVCIVFIEIGKHLPLLANITGGEFGAAGLVKLCPSSKIARTYHSRIASDGRKAGHDERKRAEREQDQVDQKKYDKAVSHARKLYREGDKSLPHIMAKWLKYNTTNFKDLELDRLRKELKPVAAEFGIVYRNIQKSSVKTTT